ncbi:biotin--[acetyl-CoA-carboxylase] ligase [Frondihabitans australicus]|uniref:biotin--[biotin carboxyl-carrier protein] ligase n=1 Tax=Frondihabitans australicus TaxID=386892 RepID=A0A495ICM4_9MICO|nr:biotin--[acetyl-CoA-carboxylase] ligase [Frondihabitans australicus]RKR73218.1 BirA family biotin operon repressor/biotin-[acetyl-CoA-carboxylase] ligase [Frondihabitans australicus]
MVSDEAPGGVTDPAPSGLSDLSGLSGRQLLPITAATASHLDFRHTTGSTNTDLAAIAASLPHLAVVASLDQRSGRGRLDRRWSSPAGQTLAASVLLRPRTPSGGPLPDDAWAWFPLLAGTALHGAIADLLPDADVTVKWPNDVQIRGLKVSGLLAELVAVDGAQDAVVMGAGLNLTIPPEHLPTPTSTSLAIEGAAGSAYEIADAVFASYLVRLDALVTTLGGDAGAAAVRQVVEAVCGTLGRRVRVELPDGTNRFGTAQNLDDGGRLVVLEDDSSALLTVSAGDVTHLRYE